MMFFKAAKSVTFNVSNFQEHSNIAKIRVFTIKTAAFMLKKLD